MSLKDLEQYQETGRRNPTDFNSNNQQVSISEQMRDKEIRLERRKQHEESLKETKEKTEWSNTYKKYIPLNEFTEELIEKEIEFTPYI